MCYEYKTLITRSMYIPILSPLHLPHRQVLFQQRRLLFRPQRSRGHRHCRPPHRPLPHHRAFRQRPFRHEPPHHPRRLFQRACQAACQVLRPLRFACFHPLAMGASGVQEIRKRSNGTSSGFQPPFTSRCSSPTPSNGTADISKSRSPTTLRTHG